ncbi:ParB family protein (plasmid) [Calothrix parasitica NIES-267]|uniref:ParB family protein n=1 Tax=Calothrix parasitica NIES-267 TaxID=1973488 RepID=A0A1Z4M317_9CYAN|nr:ParB family protein [Calothrix parasitica NIES-267]
MSKKDQPYSQLQGVAALLEQTTSSQDGETEKATKNQISIELIQTPANQPRRYFDPEKLESLTKSINAHGVIEPLLVRPKDGKYELVAGERRLRASKQAGLSEVPVIIRDLDDTKTSQIRLVENLQREDLNPLEETEGILELLSIELNQPVLEAISILHRMQNEAKGKVTQNVLGNEKQSVEKVFTSLGTIGWQSFVTSRLPLLKLPEDVLEVLRQGRLEYTKAIAIAKIKDKEQREQLLAEVLEKNLSLKEIKERIEALKPAKDPEKLSLKQRVDDTFRRLKKSKALDDEKKKKSIEKLLTQMEALMK